MDELPEHIKANLNGVHWDISLINANDLSPFLKNDPKEEHPGFILVECILKDDLPKRLLWISGTIEFSNGYKRKFENLSFHALEKGNYFNIKKMDFNFQNNLKIKSFTIQSAAMK